MSYRTVLWQATMQENDSHETPLNGATDVAYSLLGAI